jgi:hypothetical protein
LGIDGQAGRLVLAFHGTASTPPDLPEADPDDAEKMRGRPSSSSSWSFIEETKRLRAHKAFEDG